MRIFLFLLLFPVSYCQLLAESAVTYEESIGRFGDQLLGYIHAKWVSYKYGLRLLYKPFRHSEYFALHEQEELWTEDKEQYSKDVIFYINDDTLDQIPKDDAILIIPFFSDLEDDRKFHLYWTSMAIDWNDRGFRQCLRNAFAPSKGKQIEDFSPTGESWISARDESRIAMISQKNEHLTVAMHIRRGGKIDSPRSHILWPMRFAPNQYYIDSLKKLSSMYPNIPLHVHIFTDDWHPQQIAFELQSFLSDLPIFLSYQEHVNRDGAHAIEDLFTMLNFDCLIRSASNYTLIPSLIGNYKVVMTPKSGYWTVENGARVHFFIDEIDVQSLDLRN